MIIDKIIQFLNNQEYGVSAYAEVTKNVPTKYIIVEQTGETVTDYIWHATVAIKSYSSVSLFDASLLNEDVLQLMLDEFVKDDDVAKVELNSSYNFTDTTTKTYRYQAVFDITYYN